jgi:hypothetical protein
MVLIQGAEESVEMAMVEVLENPGVPRLFLKRLVRPLQALLDIRLNLPDRNVGELQSSLSQAAQGDKRFERAQQIEAVTEALELTSRAVEGIDQAHLPLSVAAVQEAEAHLFRAHSYLTILLRNITRPSSESRTANDDGSILAVHEDDRSAPTARWRKSAR